MAFEVIISPEAARDLQRLGKSEPKAFAKANRFIEELKTHPKTGLGHPEPLKGNPEGRWSREITCSLPMGITTTSSIRFEGGKVEKKHSYAGKKLPWN